MLSEKMRDIASGSSSGCRKRLLFSGCSAFKKEVPLTLHMDINNRQTPIYDGYTSYIMGNRASEKDTFTVTKNSDTLNLDDVTLSYYLVTYNAEQRKIWNAVYMV